MAGASTPPPYTKGVRHMVTQWQHNMARALAPKKSTNLDPCIGIIASVEPFKATIRDGAFVLDKTNTYICQAAIQKAYEYDTINGTVSHGEHSGEGFTAERGVITLRDVLVVGQQVLVVPIQYGQKFVVVDVLAGGWA